MPRQTAKQPSNKTFALVGLLFSLMSSANCYLTRRFIGFPDGHVTEYDQFYLNEIYPVELSVSAVMVILFTFSLYRKKYGKILLLPLVIALVAFLGVEGYYSYTLENGQGG